MRQPLSALAIFLVLIAPACNKKDAGASAAASASAAVPAVPAGTTVTFTVPKAGTKLDEKDAMSMNFSIAATQNGKNVMNANVTNKQAHDSAKEVLASNSVGPTKVRITYTRREETETNIRGKEHTKKSPLEGNTYVVERKGDEVLVTREDGKKISKKETDEVKKDNHDLGKPDPFRKMLPDHALTKGEKIEPSKDAIRDLFSNGEEDAKPMDVDKAELVFQGTKSDGKHTAAVFDMKIGVTGYPDKTMGMQMQLVGTLSIDVATGWPLAVSMSGPLVVKGDDAAHHVQISGEGKMTMSADYTYK